MTALAAELGLDQESWKFRVYANSRLAAVKFWKGASVFFDTSTGKITKGQASTTLKFLGVADRTVDNTSGTTATLNVNFLKEKRVLWRVNDGSVVAASLGSSVYCLDDQTVTNTSGGSTRSVQGTALDLDATLGVAVEVEGL